MATTTPNYGWDVPTSSDYVKLGAVAIETLGDDIDSTLYTALGGNYPGMRLVKKQTIGSGVSSVTVTSAFSATYDAYKIIVTGGAGASNNGALSLQLGSTATNYNYILNYAGYASGGPSYLRGNAVANFVYVGNVNVDGIFAVIELQNPFLSKQTGMHAQYADLTNTGMTTGFQNSNTSFTAFTLSTGSAMTGGTISVYGYGIS
jgi:hypothetical protein